jgi:4-amino-4-deoxy-L-arabinose transferase-like glycosyltransferase
MVLAGSVVVAAVLAIGAHRLGRAAVVLVAAATLFGLAAPTAFSIYNVAHSPSGPGTMSGPSRDAGFGDRPPGSRPTDETALAGLVEHVDSRWAAATVGSHLASSLELKAGVSVMAIGGFSGADNSPTLAQFQAYVGDGQVRYFIADSRGGPPGRESGSAADITTWVKQNFTPTDVGGTSVYDLQSR